jgi:hypothetical protein
MPELNLNDDLSSADGLETVTITQAGTLEEQTASALRRPVSLREIEASGGALQHGDVKFQVPAEGLTFAPDTGDTLTDGADLWDVLDADLVVMRSRYQLWCRYSGEMP